jgi:cytochrome c553
MAALVAAAVAPGAAKASDDAAAAAFEAMSFKDKVALCAACHGAKGVSDMPGTPSLAGQPVNVIEYQLLFIHYDQRKCEVMAPYTHAMTNDDIQAFGEYYPALPPPPGAPDNDAALTKAGAKLDNGHCETCHIPTGQSDTPRLDGQREDYLVKSLEDYKNGLRSGRGLGVMPEVAYGLSENEMRELAHYFSVKTGH